MLKVEASLNLGAWILELCSLFGFRVCVNDKAMTATISRPVRRPWYRRHDGANHDRAGCRRVIGWLRPDWGNAVYFLRDIFINLIKSIVAPLVFSTIVVGIAGAGALRKVGRMGIKALIYFGIVTTAALVIGLAVVNFTKPARDSRRNQHRRSQDDRPNSSPLSSKPSCTFFPASIIEAMVRGDVCRCRIQRASRSPCQPLAKRQTNHPRDGQPFASHVQVTNS